MADHPSKIRSEQENVIKVAVKVNKNQDPELYQALSNSSSKASLARQLMNIGLQHYLDYLLGTETTGKR